MSEIDFEDELRRTLSFQVAEDYGMALRIIAERLSDRAHFDWQSEASRGQFQKAAKAVWTAVDIAALAADLEADARDDFDEEDE